MLHVEYTTKFKRDLKLAKQCIFRGDSGFTLFEVILGLAMVAILAAISIPSLRYFLVRHEVVTLQAELLGVLQMARQEARIRGVPVSLQNRHGWSVAWVLAANEKPIFVTQLHLQHGELFWRAYPYARDYLQFTPEIWNAADNGLFWYCRYHDVAPIFAVAVSKSGSAHVIEPDDLGEIKDSRGRLVRCAS